MKRTRHKRVPSVRRRALQVIAANPGGCTEAMLAALDIPAGTLIELCGVEKGLVQTRAEEYRFPDTDRSWTRPVRMWAQKESQT
jgi:hypothetical protein